MDVLDNISEEISRAYTWVGTTSIRANRNVIENPDVYKPYLRSELDVLQALFLMELRENANDFIISAVGAL